MSDDAPKSAFELAMERLRKKDREEGVEDTPLTDEQRSAIAEAKKLYEAKLAEREILYHAARSKARDAEALAARAAKAFGPVLFANTDTEAGVSSFDGALVAAREAARAARALLR